MTLSLYISKTGKDFAVMYQSYNNNNNNNNYYQENYSQQTPIQKTKKTPGSKIVALALCFSLVGGAIGTGGTYFALKDSSSSSSSAVSQQQSQDETKNEPVLLSTPKTADSSTVNVADTASENGKMTAAEVYKANVNSTVGITTSINTNYFGYKTTAAASGSGFIISSDGYIVTNHHVIEDATKITVTLYDGKKYEGELVGSDESNDIAVVKIDAQDLTPVKLGSSSALSVGDEVAAIGNPLGELTFSLTTGVVSALDRTITAENTTMSLIQTDAAINAGNSGGALFNMQGEVIGVTNAKYSSSGMGTASIDNIGFAIPIDNVKSIIESLIKNGYAASPYIGVGISASSAQSEDDVSGAVIKKVYDDSPAQKAGLKEGDVITEINGKKINSGSELTSFIKTTSKGDKLVCKVNRNGSSVEVTITVDEKTSEQTQSSQSSQKQSKSSSGDMEDFDIFGNFPLY